MPKFIIIVRATSTAESGTPPSTELMGEMMTYNSSLVNAGILLSADGLLPSSKGARVTFDNSNNSTVSNGPFDIQTLMSGFWLIKAKDLQEAIDWAKKAPFRDNDSVLEVRQIAGADDFGDQMTDELRKAEADLRNKLDGKS